jgi:hypothetical protein
MGLATQKPYQLFAMQKAPATFERGCRLNRTIQDRLQVGRFGFCLTVPARRSLFKPLFPA